MAKPRPRRPSNRRESIEKSANWRLNFIITVLLIAIAIEGLYILSQSSLLNVKHISVSGNNKTTKNHVIKVSGLSTKTSWPGFSTTATEIKLEREPWIKEATVKRVFPLDVVISVTERVPAVVLDIGQTFYLVDGEDVVLDVRKQNTFPGPLLLISDVPVSHPIMRGQRIDEAAFINAMDCLEGIERGIIEQATFISASSVDGLAITVRSGLVILYGKAELMQSKNYAIAVILEEARKEGKNWAYIDVRVPSNPAAMPVPVLAPAPTPAQEPEAESAPTSEPESVQQDHTGP